MRLDKKKMKSRIRRWRTKSNIPISEMARVGGVSEATIRRYDDPSDPRDPSLFVVAKICAHYGVSIDWLLFGPMDEMDDRARFRMVLDHLALSLPVSARQGLFEFIRGVTYASLRMGKNAAPLIDSNITEPERELGS